MKKVRKSEAMAKFDALYVSGRSWLVGIDEAGRGALAGPVCAAAAAVSAECYKRKDCIEALGELDDSKRLSPEARERVYSVLAALKKAGLVDYEAAFASVEEIEKLNILAATRVAMQRACSALNERLGLNLRSAGQLCTLFGESASDMSTASVVIDGKPLKGFAYAHAAIVKGDASSLAIAAASVVAKVERDRLMGRIAEKYPRFMFGVNKGYGTAAHMQALMLFGPSAVHRGSFLKNIRDDAPRQSQAELF